MSSCFSSYENSAIILTIKFSPRVRIHPTLLGAGAFREIATTLRTKRARLSAAAIGALLLYLIVTTSVRTCDATLHASRAQIYAKRTRDSDRLIGRAIRTRFAGVSTRLVKARLDGGRRRGVAASRRALRRTRRATRDPRPGDKSSVVIVAVLRPAKRLLVAGDGRTTSGERMLALIKRGGRLREKSSWASRATEIPVLRKATNLEARDTCQAIEAEPAMWHGTLRPNVSDICN